MESRLNNNVMASFGKIIFSLWLISTVVAMSLGALGPILNGFASALFAFWDFVLYLGIPSLAVLLASGVVLCKNPINALFCLIGVFLNAIVLLLAIRVEFLSMILLIVYIGAIAILFLFVIMLLNLKNLQYPKFVWTFRNKIVAIFFSIVSFNLYINLVKSIQTVGYSNLRLEARDQVYSTFFVDNAHYFVQISLNDVFLFSNLFYNYHAILFLLSAMILLSSMIAAIVLAMSTIEA